MDPLIAARGLSFTYPGASSPTLQAVDLELRSGELLGVVGPNGSGKTTLLRLLLGVLTPGAGSVTIQQQDAASWDPRALARTVGVVVQREEPAFPIRAAQAVQLGRYPHLPPFGAPRAADRAAVARALARADVTHLAERWVASLSGGEWQRVRVARALAQEPRALVLDEATANLDIRHEMDVFELVSTLVREEGVGALMVTHHVNLAARFADRIMVLDGGRVVAAGAPAQALTKAVLQRVFDWPVAMTDWRGAPQVVPLRRNEN